MRGIDTVPPDSVDSEKARVAYTGDL